MKKYRKIPIVVHAEAYREGLEDGWDTSKIADEIINKNIYRRKCKSNNEVFEYPYLKTVEGKKYINKGDYILTNPHGDRELCKADVFEKTYEIVD